MQKFSFIAKSTVARRTKGDDALKAISKVGDGKGGQNGHT